MTPVSISRGHMREPVVVTRLALFIYSGSIALCFCVVIALGVWYTIDRRNQAADRVQYQSAQIQRLQDVTSQLKKITSPTPEQYRQQIKEGIQRCLDEPECKKLFPTIEDK